MMAIAWLSSTAHLILQWFCRGADQRFKRQNNQLEAVQRQRLAQVLAQSSLAKQHNVTDYEGFCRQFQPTRYADWKAPIQQWRTQKQPLSASKLIRYQPTSGSSEQIKFIPYTQAFLDELDHAIAPWLSSMYRRCPQLAQGKHYWSVSWLPESQREILKDDNLNDDSALLGIGKRILAKFTQAVPSEIAFAAHAEDAMFATLCYLVAERDLSMISVWSPTFALQLLDQLQQYAEEIAQVLAHGQWGERQASLQAVMAPYAPKRAQALQQWQQAGASDIALLWEKLSFVSSWDTAGSKKWAQHLQAALPFAQFEGKGLWATEGVVTIPYEGMYPLAYHSHFYEFEYLAGEQIGQIIPSWQLQIGDVVSPILSSGNGLLRYCLDDCLKVTGFFGQVPCFEFQGRRFGVDLVGEKLSPEIAQQVIAMFAEKRLQAISLLAIETEQPEKPFYCALIEGQFNPTQMAQFAAQLDLVLRQNFHYELARDLGQLAPPQCFEADNGWEAYKQLVMRDGMIEGNIKPEPLKKVSFASLQHFQATKNGEVVE
ncbi:GH3 auxin-responsive promoter family protein [Acinetobacter sp. VNK23]|uniref:GH3 family domain-containing protein n=1 Tax=Acinetobacter thutiue TaxID=2998078 RepID=UPI002575FE4B|nr:GH3 auxin-responsive promoter family protein [Acinetobacter thutiue]MDM1021826.1 GH3 auxin-responsive promoter family protein [Acinetobacter thutiue]